MEIFERVRYLRKNHLKISQEKFGEILGVNRSVIKNIELNLLVKPEQKEPLYKLICKEFNVSYDWLTTGKGEMFVETKKTFVEKLSAEYGLSYYVQKLLDCYFELDEERQAYIEEFLQMFVNACNAGVPADRAFDETANTLSKNNTEKPITKTDAQLALEEEAAAFAEMARQQFLAEKKRVLKIYSANESGVG